MRRLIITGITAATIAAALTGCATTTGPHAVPTPSETATSTPTRVAATPSPTDTAVADPKAVEPTAAPPAPSEPAAAPSVSALAQHIYEQCSLGAAENGITLTFTEKVPTGYVNSAGKYQLVYPFTFNDGHEDPYAIYNCGLTDNTVTSQFLAGGITDTH